jgi:hypothetical protein
MPLPRIGKTATRAGRRPRKPSSRREAVFEPLETRHLLSVWVVTGLDQVFHEGVTTPLQSIVGTADSDVIVFADDTARLTGGISGGGGEDTVIYAATAPGDYLPGGTPGYTGPVAINLQTGEATGAGNGLASIEHVIGGAGQNTLTAANAGNLWFITGNDAGSIGQPAVFHFDVFQTLVGGTGSDTFTFAAGVTVSGSVDGGHGGDDKVVLSAFADDLAWDISATGVGGVATGGAPLLSFADVEQFAGGSGSDIFTFADGTVQGQIDGGGGDDRVDLSAETSDLTWGITGPNAGNLQGGGRSAALENVENLVSGQGDDSFVFGASGRLDGSVDGGGGVNVLDYSGFSGDVPVTVNLETQTATALGGWLSIQAAVGGPGGDTLVGLDVGNTWSVEAANSGQVVSLPLVFGFESFEMLQGGPGPEKFVFSADAVVSTGVAGGGGSDALDLSAYATDNFWRVLSPDSGQLQAIGGVFSFSSVETLLGGGGADQFIFANGLGLTGRLDGGTGPGDWLDLQAYTADLTWDIAAADAGTVSAGIDFSGVENLLGGRGDDVFQFQDGASVGGSVSGGQGDNTIDMSAYATDAIWHVGAADAGQVAAVGSFAFDTVQNLTGGSGADTFVVAAHAGVAGLVDGGSPAGVNLLDYQDWEAGDSVVVDRQQGTATGTGGYANLQGVIGGAGSDRLVGLDSDSLWTVTADNAGTVVPQAGPPDAFTFASVENLHGGAEQDVFEYGDGASIAGSIDGGGGDDTLDLSAYAAGTQWRIADDFGGQLTTADGTAPFQSVENLRAGAGTDTFVLDDAVIVQSIDGGAGADLVDATAYTVPIFLRWTDKVAGDGELQVFRGENPAPAIVLTSIQDFQKSSTAVIGDTFVDLVGTLQLAPVFSRILPHETGAVSLAVTNQGNQAVEAIIDVTVYASADATVDVGADRVLGVLSRQKIKLLAGASATLKGTLTVPTDMPAGSYVMIAQIDSAGAVPELSEQNNYIVSDVTLNVVWEFGSVLGKNKALTVKDAGGTLVTFALRGDGVGAIVGGTDFTEIFLTGTTKRTQFVVTRDSRATAAVTLKNITARGPLGGMALRGIDVAGAVHVQGQLGSATVGNMLAGSSLTVDGPEPSAALAFSSIADASMTFGGGVKTFTAGAWIDTGAADVLTAPWIGSFSISGRRDDPRTKTVNEALRGDMQADLDLSGAGAPRGVALGTFRVTGLVDGSIAVAAGGIGAVAVGRWQTGSVEAGWLNSLTTAADRRDAAVNGDWLVGLTLTGLAAPKGVALGSAKVAGAVRDCSMTVGGGVKAFAAAAWLDTGVADVLSAPWIGSFTISGRRDDPSTKTVNEALRGDMQADLGVSGAGAPRGLALGTFKVTGLVDGSVAVGAGGIGAIAAGRWQSGSAAADWLVSMTTSKDRLDAAVNGDWLAGLTLTGLAAPKGVALGSAKVAGAIRDCALWFGGNVTTLSAGELLNADVLLGALALNGLADDFGVPGGRSEFTLKSLQLAGILDAPGGVAWAMKDSDVAAWTVGAFKAAGSASNSRLEYHVLTTDKGPAAGLLRLAV